MTGFREENDSDAERDRRERKRLQFYRREATFFSQRGGCDEEDTKLMFEGIVEERKERELLEERKRRDNLELEKHRIEREREKLRSD
ncbi:hypothetical protein TNCV_4771641 [Trichonephila clavipes]|nr:hypothetical protein TNCV_4771641 [Trichonephila clavipes]